MLNIFSTNQLTNIVYTVLGFVCVFSWVSVFKAHNKNFLKNFSKSSDTFSTLHFSPGMELVESRNGSILVIHENYRFSRTSEQPKGLSCRWICTKPGCSAIIVTDTNTSMVLRGGPFHNHEPPEREDVSVKRKKKKVRKKAKSLPKLIEDTKSIKTLSNEDIQLVRQSMLMEKGVKRIKEETGRLAEGLYDSLHVTIPLSEEVLQINNNGRSMVCFTTISNLDLMCESDTILIDRTFPQCSGYFHQLLTIYCPISYQPFAHILLPEDYCSFQEIFEKLVVHCIYLGMRFEPRTIQSNLVAEDFSFLRRLYPLCSIQEEKSGATESWWMKIKDLGLTDEFPDVNSNVAKWLRWTFPMFYLNHSDVADSFMEDLKSQTTSTEIMDLYSYYLVDSDTCRSSQD